MACDEQLIDQDGYRQLEDRFREQVARDRTHTIDRVKQGWGVYLPVEKPVYRADYVLVGMEPSMGWAENALHAEQMVAAGKIVNFGCDWPGPESHVLKLFCRSIERFLCGPNEHHYLTDLSKGAMMVEVAAIDRGSRYMRWYELLLDELAIVAKPKAPVIAIGSRVGKFLRGRKLAERTEHNLHEVPHYSLQNWRVWETEAKDNRDGFRAFQRDVLKGSESPWPRELSERKQMLVYAYYTRFVAIRVRE